MNRASQLWPVPRAISGSKERVPRSAIGRNQQRRLEHLLTVGCELVIFIAATRMDSGSTWAAATTVSSQAVNGYRRLRWKEFCCDMLASRGQQSWQILTPTTSLVRVPLW